MLPNREKALQMLEEAHGRNPGPWREHSMVVAQCAYEISKRCEDMDEEKAYIIGILHDIGRREGVTGMAHIIDGYRYLMSFGYDEAARICITHSFSTQNMEMYIGKIDVSEEDYRVIRELLESYDYDDYDRLIQVCDSIALPDGPVDIEIRMGDVKKRYGYYPEATWNKNIELLKYFEEKSGLDIGDLHI